MKTLSIRWSQVSWSFAFLSSWVLVIWLPPQAAIYAAAAILACWVLAAVAAARSATALKRELERQAPGVIEAYSVGSLSASWNHARLIRAASAAMSDLTSPAPELLLSVLAWRRATAVMLVLAPVTAVTSYFVLKS